MPTSKSNQALHIKIIHHPHTNISDPTIIALESDADGQLPEEPPSESSGLHLPKSTAESLPWAPFRNLQDFEYTEIAVRSRLSKANIDAQLQGMHNGWAIGSRITLRNHKDMERVLMAARAYVVQFQEGTVSAEYDEQTFTFKFPYRDPWEVYQSWITDPTLSQEINWYPVRKYLCEEGKDVAIYDDINTGTLWWEIQDTLPNVHGLPHCFLPAIFWLDKGMITKRVRKHPMLLRPAFLPRAIRNGSGNGGGILVGYMPVIRDPSDPSDRNSAGKIAFACFKREVYHKVLAVVFGSLRSRGRCGEAMKCGDQVQRVIYPGIPIASVDSEESWALTSTRAGLADYPCPKCLVHNCSQHNLASVFEPRTVEGMMQAYHDAMECQTKSGSERILQQNGLHKNVNFFWSLPHSDPYRAISYDKLHADDLGKFGKHLWRLLLSILEDLNVKGQLTINMRGVDRWSNLKHFLNVTTIEYADGTAFFDILRCLLPCIVQLLPKNSVLVNCLHAYAQIRTMIQMRCMTEDRIQRLQGYIKTYMDYCSRVSTQYEKNFDFLKQHLTTHIIPDIRQKGTLDNYDTRVGEGFHQEVQEAYKQTNCKNTEPQMARIDENLEAVARIHMLIDNASQHESTLAKMIGSDEVQSGLNATQTHSALARSNKHWILGSPAAGITDAKGLADELVARGFVNEATEFQNTLFNFLRKNISPDCVEDSHLEVRVFQCLYLTYQSLEDWKEGRDILRCNPDFHSHARYDCALVNTDSKMLSPVRLRMLVRCMTSRGPVDIALVHSYKRTQWKPKTVWEGMHVFEQVQRYDLVMIRYLVRGVHMVKAFGTKDGREYLNDTIDGDMFLRAGN
ncbi:hypothetical protein DEU56DRAFT_729847 [Suillus clintonianus]|uniref:uncharacterized protein n=1 Tax=Suillus clintonianus TaxID=1904413 RepID=UPI001B87B4D6|nr:uncharacterized protein DEU56DRAFT_729847 [Suillus clintonianus]KAG2148877.1 hypothetical protein DEU56DRAFT_729847 [Suillus clintonianus]